MKDKISKRIVLHLVPPKIGATSIQTFLDRARDALLEHGIRYADAGRIRNKQTVSEQRSSCINRISDPANAEHLLPWTLVGAVDGLDAVDDWDALLTGIAIRPQHTVLIGTEAFGRLKCEQVEMESTRGLFVPQGNTHVQ